VFNHDFFHAVGNITHENPTPLGAAIVGVYGT
jgi:hypothetical protein